MKIVKSTLLVCMLLVTEIMLAQTTHGIINPDQKFKSAQDFFYKSDYASAYPLLKDLVKQYPLIDADSHHYITDKVHCFYIVCELRLNQSKAAEDAKVFLERNHNESLGQLMLFHLGHYYFNRNDYDQALNYLTRSGYNNLTNEQIGDAKFEIAYSFFKKEKYKDADPLFNEIVQIVNSKYYLSSFYYGGMIAYKNKDYEKALQYFKKVEVTEPFSKEVAYYITEILYCQGKKREALDYGDSILRNNTSLQGDKNLKMLVGQLYFEKQDYEKSLPLLQFFINQTEKVPKEILYELSFCYYKNNINDKAIEGFRELSNEKDSMGQNSMYLLGTLYLSIQDKSNARNAFQFCAYNSSNQQQQEISRFIYAKLSYELGFQDVAMAELKIFLTLYPNSVYSDEAKELMVNMLAITNNFSEGLLFYNTIVNPSVSLQKVYIQLLYGSAVQNINDQHFNEADQLLDQILSSPQPSKLLPYARYWKAEVSYKQQRYRESVLLFTSFIDANPVSFGEANLFNAKYSLAYARFQLQQYKLANNLFSSIYNSNSVDTSNIQQDILLRMADCNYMQKEYAKSKNQYDFYISKNFFQSDYALFQKAMIAGINSSVEKIQLLRYLMDHYPNGSMWLDAKMEIANTYISDLEFEKAIPYLSQIISDSSAFKWWAVAYLKLGLAYYNSNDNKKALGSLTTLLSRYPNSNETEEGLSIIKEIYVDEGKPEEYFELLRTQHIAINIIEADSLSYAVAYRKYDLGNYTEAHKSFSMYIKNYPSGNYFLPAHYYDALANVATKNFEDALNGFKYVINNGTNPYFDYSSSEIARIYYFELKNYDSAKKFFTIVYNNTNIAATKLDAMRGLVRSYYKLNDYTSANEIASELFHQKNISTDDKSIALLVLGKSQQQSNLLDSAIINFKAVSVMNRSAWGAEARYEMAVCYFKLNNLKLAEAAAMAVIKETSAYDYWVTKSYILLGDLFVVQKDYFNAKATYESIYKNSDNNELKEEALNKYNQAVALEKKSSKISN